MDKLILYLITIFLITGGIDYILGSPLKLGNKFEEGIKAMGALGFGMIGIYSLAPILSNTISPMIIPIFDALKMDSSIFPAALLAMDLGGYQIAERLASSPEMVYLSGISIASTLGTAISFSIPVALGMLPKEDEIYFSKGVLVGIIAITIGCFVAGLWLKMNIGVLVWNLLPILVFAMVLGVGLLKATTLFIKGFSIFGKGIIGLSVIGLLLQGLHSLVGIQLIKGLAPLSEAMAVVGKTAFVMGGAFPMLALINRLFKGTFDYVGDKFGINSVSVAGLLGNLASNLLIFGSFKDMNPKGKVVCTAFAMTCSFLLGGQLGFVSGVAEEMLGLFILTKLSAGVVSILLAGWLYEYEVKVYHQQNHHICNIPKPAE